MATANATIRFASTSGTPLRKSIGMSWMVFDEQIGQRRRIAGIGDA